MKKLFFLSLIIISFSFSYQIDRDENFTLCLKNENFSFTTFYVVNISNDIKFKILNDCLILYSMKNTTYGKKFVTILLTNCYNPFDIVSCQASAGKLDVFVKKRTFYFLVNKSYYFVLEYNQTVPIHTLQKIYLKIRSNSNGASNFGLYNFTISPIKKIKYYKIYKSNNGFIIEYFPLIEGKYKVSFNIVRNNFEEKKFNFLISGYPTPLGKLKNINNGLVIIPNILQGFYSLINLIFYLF